MNDIEQSPLPHVLDTLPPRGEVAAGSDRPMTDMEIKLQLSIYADRCKQAHKQASAVAVGRKAIIVSNFNGQPHGRSRKPLTGKVVTISSVSLYSDGQVSFCSWDVPDAGFGADDVEFIS